MMNLQFWFAIFLTWKFCAVRSIPIHEVKVHSQHVDLSPDDAAWTVDSKQNIWELSGEFEGDMILSVDQRNGQSTPNFRWPNKEIPYEFDPIYDEAQKNLIIHALSEIENNTCIKPRLRNNNDKDYVYITAEESGCKSQVGRRGGKQKLNLEPKGGCLRLGIVVHEFLHALGFYHQQSATNRDDFVKILWDNIKPGEGHNFQKQNHTTSFGEEYDYNSLMHYSAYS